VAALGFAFVLAVFRGRASRHLLPISMALTGATALAILWYAFGQDWVMTIVFNDYWGWAYAVVLMVLSAFMFDIALNRARLTSIVFNSVGNLVGTSLHLAPC
ncbi:MAG: hypothetical protein MI723_02645, partial [Caulobacterales bacterium]|nr:hypothetical protein [Caulobacterales bacterium]